MDDLISRQAAIDVAMRYCPDDDGTCSKAGTDLRELLDELEDLPTAEPQERKTGRWIRDEFGSRCGACGLYAYRDKFDRPWESPYCPNCGARMEGTDG